VSILARYFVASYFRLFAAALAVSTLAITVVEMLVNFDKIFSSHGLSSTTAPALRSAVSYLFLRIPSYYLRDLIPISAFAAAFLCVGLPARRSEITAARAGGISPLRIAVPVLCAATVLSGVSLAVNETFVLDATQRWSQLGLSGARIAFRQGSFWYRRGDRIYNIWEADPDRQRLRGVRVYELDAGGRLLRAIRASSARIAEGGRWEFEKPVVHTFRAGRPDRGPRIELLPSLSLEIGNRKDAELLSAQRSSLGLRDLYESLTAKRAEGRSATRDSALLQRRLTEPLACLLFALLAIPAGFRVERTRNIAVSALVGIVWLGAYQFLRISGNLMLAPTTAAAVLAPWVVFGAFAALGTRQLLRVPR
jgi:lipopolysaccharide export system permease protein